MDYFGLNANEVAKRLSCDVKRGLDDSAVIKSRAKHGANVISKKKGEGVLSRIVKALFEPMMVILLFAFFITLGVNIGKAVKGTGGDFYECVGIAVAIALSVSLTVIMEGRSKKAFEFLRSVGDDLAVKVLRGGEIKIVRHEELVVGDIVFNEAGDKISADGRIISCEGFKVDESDLTGESKPVKKDEKAVVLANAPLAERKNMVYSGSFVAEGRVCFIVTAVGDNAEIGKVALSVGEEKSISAPLNEKLDRLGKFISIFGLACAGFVFVLSLIRLIVLGNVTFDSVEDVFIQSIVLIVAAVPEGLPTTVAISLTLNVVKLAKSNALIKKLVATETVGCVSVICSDKTGTLTQNKMLVDRVFAGGRYFDSKHFVSGHIATNAAVNSTAELGNGEVYGSKTEGALLLALSESGIDYKKLRERTKIKDVTPFSSQEKYMATTVEGEGGAVTYYKGAPEVIFSICGLEKSKIAEIMREIDAGLKAGKRALAFAHETGGVKYYDGVALIGDKLRGGIEKSVRSCLDAGVKVKILTGDSLATATAIAAQLGLDTCVDCVATADEIESLSDEKLKQRLTAITVIARSTPKTKLKVVTALQEMGEVVAVTGDGVNDAPAIRHADIGISMGSGSEITKMASDIVLLDDSFETILTAISFGRNIFDNFQRFITFQLTVNLSSIAIIITYLVLGFECPFSSTCLLWLNVIMDGPLALSLGLENRKLDLEGHKPVKRNSDILSKRMLARIAIHSVFSCFIITLQQLYNFMNVSPEQKPTVTITLFVFFQLFNAINCREVRAQSALINIFNNKLLLVMLVLTYALHITIVSFAPSVFDTVPLGAGTYLTITAICSSVLALSEGYKWAYRAIKRKFSKKTAKFAIMNKSKIA